MVTPDKDGYDAYIEIKSELVKPISDNGLDGQTVKRLYESKAVYLENLRIKCFREMNQFRHQDDGFNEDDYQFILNAAKINRNHLRSHIMAVIKERLGAITDLPQ